MYNAVYIGGIRHGFSCLEIGDTVSFEGIGGILASAIKRTSKNAYLVYIIFTWHAEHYEYKGVKIATQKLQHFYNQ